MNFGIWKTQLNGAATNSTVRMVGLFTLDSFALVVHPQTHHNYAINIDNDDDDDDDETLLDYVTIAKKLTRIPLFSFNTPIHTNHLLLYVMHSAMLCQISVVGWCDVYVGGKVRIAKFMIFLDLQHRGSK